MSTTTKTISNAFESLNLRGKDKTPPGSVNGSHIIEPLVPSGALNEKEFPRVQLTPAIGIEFGKEVRLAEILRLPDEKKNALLKDLAILISHNGVAFFQDQSDLKPEDLATLGLLLGELSGKPSTSTLHIHPTQELTETGLPIGKISNEPDADGRQISFQNYTLTSDGWHSDVSFEPVPAAYTLLKMHTIPETGGDTLWHSGYHTYDSLSPALQSFLEGLTATHDAERFREQSRTHGFKLRTAPRGSPENQGDSFSAVHPVVRTNPVTGLKSVYVNKTFTKRINELGLDESTTILNYLFTLQHGSHDAHIKYKWSKDNLAVWDNRSTSHLATFDYTQHRAGDRAVVVGEKPYFDPASSGKREFLAKLKAQKV